jgi:uncharacterized membrane protein YukC
MATGYAVHQTGMHITSVIGLVLGLSTICVTLLYLSIYWYHKVRRDKEEILEVGRERFVKDNTARNIVNAFERSRPAGVRDSAF